MFRAIASASAGARATSCGILALVFWSFAAPAIALAQGVHPFLYVTIEHGIACLVFMTKWAALRENPLPDIRRAPLWLYAAGLVGLPLHQLTWVAALHQAPPLEATLIIYTWPLMVVVLTALTLKRRLQAHHLLAAALGFAGIAVLLAGRGLAFGDFTPAAGHGLALVCALSWSLFAALSARQSHIGSAFLAVVCGISVIVNGAVWYLYMGAPMAPVSSLVIVVGISILTALGYLLWDFGMKHGNTRLIATSAFMTPVLAAFYLVALGKGALTPYLAVALLMVVSAIALARHESLQTMQEAAP